MAKKKTKFNRAKFKNGILSYNYLGGEAGKGRGAVSIKQDGDDWYFVDKNGKVRTDVGINGKLTPTHMQNLENDGIFAAAKIKPDGTKLTKAEIKAGPDLGTPGSGGSATGDGDLPGRPSSDDIDSQEVRIPRGGESNTPLTDRSNLRLRDANETVAPNVDNARAPVNYDQTLERRGIPTNVQTASAPAINNQTPYVGEAIGTEGQNFASSNYPETVQTIPTDPRLAMPNRPGEQSWEGTGQMRLPQQDNTNVIAANVSTPRHINDPNSMMGPVYSSSVDPIAPGLNTGTLDIGKGGEGVTQWGGDDAFYRTKDGTLMKDSGWFGGDDTVATQADIDAGIKDQNASPWGSAAGWQAAGSVMKGVGGLASAYTGIKNYQLARDAFSAQKNQWQADYNQRLKAYEDNKALANQEIDARNRVLRARGQGTKEDPLIKHI